MPMVALDQPNWSRIGRIAILMLTRSMLQSMKATKQSARMVHLCFHPVVVSVMATAGLVESFSVPEVDEASALDTCTAQ